LSNRLHRGRLARRLGIVAGVLVLATLAVVTPPVWAAPYGPGESTTDGAAASCVVSTVGANLVRIVCTLNDSSRDGDSVYVGWRTTVGGVRSLYDRSGSGHSVTVTGYAPTAPVPPPYRVLWKVCRDKQAPWKDDCSDWRGEWAAAPA
jgi:hypothetical protein